MDGGRDPFPGLIYPLGRNHRVTKRYTTGSNPTSHVRVLPCVALVAISYWCVSYFARGLLFYEIVLTHRVDGP